MHPSEMSFCSLVRPDRFCLGQWGVLYCIGGRVSAFIQRFAYKLLITFKKIIQGSLRITSLSLY